MSMSARDRQVAIETVRPRSECHHCNPPAMPDRAPTGLSQPDLTMPEQTLQGAPMTTFSVSTGVVAQSVHDVPRLVNDDVVGLTLFVRNPYGSGGTNFLWTGEPSDPIEVEPEASGEPVAWHIHANGDPTMPAISKNPDYGVTVAATLYGRELRLWFKRTALHFLTALQGHDDPEQGAYEDAGEHVVGGTREYELVIHQIVRYSTTVEAEGAQAAIEQVQSGLWDDTNNEVLSDRIEVYYGGLKLADTSKEN